MFAVVVAVPLATLRAAVGTAWTTTAACCNGTRENRSHQNPAPRIAATTPIRTGVFEWRVKITAARGAIPPIETLAHAF